MTETKFPSIQTWMVGIPLGRKSFLSAVPSSIHGTTCRCIGFKDWYYSLTRNMFLCKECHKPNAGDSSTSVPCLFGCGEYFTVWRHQVGHHEADTTEMAQEFRRTRTEVCRDCGGDNDARDFEYSKT